MERASGLITKHSGKAACVIAHPFTRVAGGNAYMNQDQGRLAKLVLAELGRKKDAPGCSQLVKAATTSRVRGDSAGGDARHDMGLSRARPVV